MPWLSRMFQCDWCEVEVNNLHDPVCESEKGTLCENCEKARLEEKRIYKDVYQERRVKREIERAKRKLEKETKHGDEML